MSVSYIASCYFFLITRWRVLDLALIDCLHDNHRELIGSFKVFSFFFEEPPSLASRRTERPSGAVTLTAEWKCEKSCQLQIPPSFLPSSLRLQFIEVFWDLRFDPPSPRRAPTCSILSDLYI